MLERLRKSSIPKTKKKEWVDLPRDYNVAKFFELGLYPQFNKYNDTYQCGCPICREGKSLGRKKRCYYIPEKDLVYCQNCGWSSKPYNWILEVSGISHDDLEKELREGEYGYVDLNKLEGITGVEHVPSLPEDCVNLFDDNQVKYWMCHDDKFKEVVRYLDDRKLFTAINRPDALYFSFKDHTHRNRLIIPFKDDRGDILFYQSRKIFDWDDSPRYKSKMNAQRTLFGLDKISPNSSKVFITEGPIDSFFLKDSIAVGGITEKGELLFTDVQQEQWKGLVFYDKIWVMDSQWLDETARLKTLSLIEKGERVFIWPEKFGSRYKDLNEICIDKNINQISPKFIEDNTFSGIQAKTKMKLIKI